VANNAQHAKLRKVGERLKEVSLVAAVAACKTGTAASVSSPLPKLMMRLVINCATIDTGEHKASGAMLSERVFSLGKDRRGSIRGTD
jgi:hypothetical protein